MVFDIVFEQDLAVAGSHLLVNSVCQVLRRTQTRAVLVLYSYLYSGDCGKLAPLKLRQVAMTVSAPVLGLVVKRTRKYKWATVLCCIGPVIAMGLLATLRQDSSWAVQWLSEWFHRTELTSPILILTS
jgi:hypothetical protein